MKVYTTPTCPYCHRLKEFLGRNNVDFEEIDVSSNPKAAAEIIEKSGQMGVPITEFDDGEIIVGFDEQKFREKLGIEN